MHRRTGDTSAGGSRHCTAVTFSTASVGSFHSAPRRSFLLLQRVMSRKSTTRQSSLASTQPDEEMAPAPAASESKATTRRKGVKQEAPAAAAAAAAATPAASSSSSSASENGDGDDDNDDDDDDAGGAASPAAASPSVPLFQQASLALPSSSIMQQHAFAGIGGFPPAVSPPTGIARFSTLQPHGAGAGPFVTAPTSFSRQISRLPSTAGGVFAGGAGGDWRANVAVEERITIRRKLREAYFKHCPTYEQLLEVVTAVDEELLFSCSANRLDYFKSSIDWDGRIALKRQQLKNTPTSATAAAANAAAAAASNEHALPTANGTWPGELTKKRSAEDLSGSVSLLNNSDLLPGSGGMTLPPVSALAQPKSPQQQTNKRQKKEA